MINLTILKKIMIISIILLLITSLYPIQASADSYNDNAINLSDENSHEYTVDTNLYQIYTDTFSSMELLNNDPGFCVLVNSSIYPSIKTALNQYCLDVNASGYCAKVVTGSWSKIEDVRNVLKGEWQNNGTVGAILVGGFPIPWYIISGEIFPIDLYYMDLDGNWQDSNTDGVFDGHTGNMAPDIFFGRLPSNIMTGDEAQLLNNYFRKAHDYKTGKLKLPNNNLVYVDDDWIGSADGWKNDAKINYENVTLEKDGLTTNAKDYKKRLTQGYEFVEVHCHANHKPTRHNFKVSGVFESETVNSTHIKTIDPLTFFSILFTCGSANYSAKDFLAGAYTFANTYGLASISSSKVGGMLDYNEFYTPLSNDKSIGEAFFDWFVLNSEQSRSWFYGMTLIGDPLLIPNMYDLELSDITVSNPYPHDDETIKIKTNILNSFDNCSKVPVNLYDGDPQSSGSLIATKNINFGWNESAEVSFNWVAEEGDHDFWIVVDYENKITELNENNNVGTKFLKVYPDLEVGLSSNKTKVSTYQPIKFTASALGGCGDYKSYFFEFGDGTNSSWISENYTTHSYP
ncbi:MAG: hypothetical protein JSV49_06745, partial [Thermoplasmata archaeon]